MTKIKYLILLMCAVVFSVNAQETDDGNDVEEVVVTGTQIKGARINEASLILAPLICVPVTTTSSTSLPSSVSCAFTEKTTAHINKIKYLILVILRPHSLIVYLTKKHLIFQVLKHIEFI